MSDSLSIVDLELRTRIGVTSEERTKPQRVSVTIRMDVDARTAAASDDVSKTIDYGAVVRDVEALAAKERKTMERLAEDIAAMILERHRPTSVTVTVMKFVLPNAKGACVSIARP